MTTVFKFHSKPAKAVPPGPTWAAGRSESLSLLELPPHLEVLYCTTPAQCDAALARVPIHSVWGFDIEWKVTYTKGEKMRPAALLQLSSASLVLLLHLHVCGLTPSLVQLLANPLIRKVGVNVVGDCRKLERDFPHIEVRGAYDLVKMFRIAGEIGDGNGVEDGNGNGDLGTGDGGRNGDGNGSGGRYSQVRSLASLMSTALSLELEKGAVRCSNWERVPLSADQVKYAALDAYAGFVLAEHLMRRCGAPSSTSASIAASTDWEAGTLHLWAELFAHLEIRKVGTAPTPAVTHVTPNPRATPRITPTAPDVPIVTPAIRSTRSGGKVGAGMGTGAAGAADLLSRLDLGGALTRLSQAQAQTQTQASKLITQVPVQAPAQAQQQAQAPAWPAVTKAGSQCLKCLKLGTDNFCHHHR